MGGVKETIKFPYPAFYFKNNSLFLLDQTKLPQEINYLEIKDLSDLIKAIKELKVRGAPLIGVVAGYGVYLLSQKIEENLKETLLSAIFQLKNTRPTAKNLFYVLDSLEEIIKKEKDPQKIKEKIKKKVFYFHKKEIDNCLKIAKYGDRLIPKKAKILTICNTGHLATGGLGTALGIIFYSAKKGKKITCYICETRPLFQGARLTTFEILNSSLKNIKPILITDNMVGSIMKDMDLVLVGADRVALNGDTANKIGTKTLAICAKYYKKPFYVACPTSTIDRNIKSGKEIKIEERDKEEIIKIKDYYLAPKEIECYNPAFDITENKLITAIITEKGIIYPPFKKGLLKIFDII
ncbi:MAG: S-methyl-5-thioribose-1-phosphate isomerase [candidate division WOR-3 bacterium]|nr:S-methyl-5-thioribose-1-phosphate isomerase [candidate division WOR-3 bacterium]